MMRQICAVTPGSILQKSPPTAGVLLSCGEERKGEDKMILADTEKAMRLVSTHIMYNATIITILSCRKPWLLTHKLFFFDGQEIMWFINKIAKFEMKERALKALAFVLSFTTALRRLHRAFWASCKQVYNMIFV